MSQQDDGDRQDPEIDDERFDDGPQQIEVRLRSDVTVKLEFAHHIVVQEHDQQNRGREYIGIHHIDAIGLKVLDIISAVPRCNHAHGVHDHQNGVNYVNLLLEHNCWLKPSVF